MAPLATPRAVRNKVTSQKKQSSSQAATPMAKVEFQPSTLLRRRLSATKAPIGKVKPHHDKAKGNCPAARADRVSRLAMTSHQTPKPQSSNMTPMASSRRAGNGSCSATLSRLTGMTPIGARWIHTVGVRMPCAGLCRYLRYSVRPSRPRYIMLPAPSPMILMVSTHSRAAPSNCASSGPPASGMTTRPTAGMNCAGVTCSAATCSPRNMKNSTAKLKAKWAITPSHHSAIATSTQGVKVSHCAASTSSAMEKVG